MRTHMLKPAASQQSALARSATSGPTQPGFAHKPRSTPRLQGAMGNQDAQRIMQAGVDSRIDVGHGINAGHGTAAGHGIDVLRVSKPDDSLEIEADQLADKALHVQVPEGTPATGRAKAPNSAPPQPGASLGFQASAHVRDAIGAGGRPLDARIRNFFESRLGCDLDKVRIHDDSRAAQSAYIVGAKAYTAGSDIVFAAGAYRPDAEAGRRLIAHELAHVAQSGSSPGFRRNTLYRQPDEATRDLAAIDQEIRALQQMPILPPVMSLRLEQLQRQRIGMLAAGASAPAAPTVARTESDCSLNISKMQNKCLTVTERWALYKAHVEETWSREDNYGRKLSGFADWDAYVTPDEFRRLDTDGNYHARNDEYMKYGAGGGQYERQQQERSKPVPPPPPKADWSRYDTRQIDIDRIEQERSAYFGFARQPAQPAASADVAESGCHTDPYAHHAGSTVCGQSRPDEATRATMKAMQAPAPGLAQYYKEQRAGLDRLNAAHLHWRQTGLFPQDREFAPYEIEKDRIIPVEDRWAIYNDPDPDNLERADFNERFFRSEEEYKAERQRRHEEYRAAVEACGHGPNDFKCRDKVMKTYYPGRFKLYDAAFTWASRDIQVAMPVLREGGPVAGFVFHAAHEWAGWSTERSADAANLASGLTNLAGAKLQQKYSLRNAGQSVSPPDEMTPPPEHVAPAPGRDPVLAPGKPSVSAGGAGADPWAGAGARPVDVTPGAAFSGTETTTSTALVRVGSQALTVVPRTTTAGAATTAGQPDVSAGAVAARPQLGSRVILPSVAPAPGESPAYQMPLGPEGAGGVRLMNRGLQPPDFANSGFRGPMIADDPVHLDLWTQAEARLVRSPRLNVYKDWLTAVQDGSVANWSSKELQEVYSAVWDQYKELARAQGIDVATIHHWNYNKDLYPYQVVDPRNLLPVYGQSEMRGGWHPYHQGGLHRLMSGGHPTNDPIDPVHELKLENYNVPRLNPDYPGAPFGWHPPMLAPADLPFGWDPLHPPDWVWPEGTPPSRTPR